MTELYTVAEVADLTKFGTRKIERACRAGEIPGAMRLFGRWRIPAAALADFLARAGVEAGMGKSTRSKRTDKSAA